MSRTSSIMPEREKVAVVVGGTGIVGRALVDSLTQARCHVAVVSRQRTNSESVEKLRKEKYVSMYKADFTSEDQVQESLQQIVAKQGQIDFLIYSVGIAPEMDVPLAEYPTASWRRTLDTYLTGFFLCFREGLKRIKRGGHIVVISSAVTRFTSDSLPVKVYAGHYAAAKAAVNEVVKWARREAHDKEVMLSRVAPGAIDTPFHRNAPLHRRPQGMLSAQSIAREIVEALISAKELDLEIVARKEND